MKAALTTSLLLTIAGFASAQQVAPINVSVDFDGAPDAVRQAIEKYVVNGFTSRGIQKLSDNGLDPKNPIFDDYGWVVVKPVGDPKAPYAVEVQLSILQGTSVNYMLYRFRGSLSSAVLDTPEATVFSILDKLMDEAKRDFGSPAYRHGWRSRNG